MGDLILIPNDVPNFQPNRYGNWQEPLKVFTGTTLYRRGSTHTWLNSQSIRRWRRNKLLPGCSRKNTEFLDKITRMRQASLRIDLLGEVWMFYFLYSSLGTKQIKCKIEIIQCIICQGSVTPSRWLTLPKLKKPALQNLWNSGRCFLWQVCPRSCNLAPGAPMNWLASLPPPIGPTSGSEAVETNSPTVQYCWYEMSITCIVQGAEIPVRIRSLELWHLSPDHMMQFYILLHALRRGTVWPTKPQSWISGIMVIEGEVYFIYIKSNN